MTQAAWICDYQKHPLWTPVCFFLTLLPASVQASQPPSPTEQGQGVGWECSEPRPNHHPSSMAIRSRSTHLVLFYILVIFVYTQPLGDTTRLPQLGSNRIARGYESLGTCSTYKHHLTPLSPVTVYHETRASIGCMWQGLTDLLWMSTKTAFQFLLINHAIMNTVLCTCIRRGSTGVKWMGGFHFRTDPSQPRWETHFLQPHQCFVS